MRAQVAVERTASRIAVIGSQLYVASPWDFSVVDKRSLGPPSKLVDLASISLRGPCYRRRREMHHGFALFRDFAAGFAAGFSFLIEGLCDGSGAANVAELKNLHLELPTFGFDLQHVADVDLASRFGRLLIGLDTSEITGARRHGTRLEEARGPEEFVDASHEGRSQALGFGFRWSVFGAEIQISC